MFTNCNEVTADDARKGFVDQRFKAPEKKPTYGLIPSLMSIISLAIFTASSVKLVEQLSHPNAAFHLLKPHTVNHGRHHDEIPPRADTFKQLFHDIPCLFPDVLYDTNNAGEKNAYCNTSHQCQDTGCEKEATAPLWTTLPYYFTIWGAGMGGAFEIGLLLARIPFQQGYNPFTKWISRLRLLNLAFVSTTVFFFCVCMTIPASNDFLLVFLMYFFTATAFALAPALFFGGLTSGGYDFVPPILIGMQIALFIFITSRGTVFGGRMATYVLAMVPIFQLISLLVTTATPMKSFIFHVVSTFPGFFMYIALELAGNEAPSFPKELQDILFGPSTTKAAPFLIGAGAFGWFAMMKLAPKVYQKFRSEISYYVWSLLYYVLVGNPSQPMPFRLSTIFTSSNLPRRINLQPYSQQHPYEVGPSLGIPAIDGKLPQTVEVNAGPLVQTVTGLFKVISRLDYFLPQANVNDSIAYKPRMSITDDGQDKYPRGLFHIGLLPQFPGIGKTLQRCPEPVINAFKDGNLIPWLCQYGIGNTYLQKAVQIDVYPFFRVVDAEAVLDTNSAGATVTEDTSGFVIDFRHLEAYEYKKDYEPYGGIAFLEVNKKQNLSLTWLVTPRTTTKILGNKHMNQAFRRAESMITASLYFSVIAGKHLAHIHMTYNLLEVTAHNSFDVFLNKSSNQEYNGHPVRLYLYIHLFSHGLAEELTTEHLVQEGAVFSQIFALTYDSLCDYLSREYNDFTYAEDEDFDLRKAIQKPLRSSKPTNTPYEYGAPFSTGLDWELEYYDIFLAYATNMTSAIYGKNDTNVKNDAALQEFYGALECVFNKLPSRYESFQTIKGVTCFLADSSQHLVVRHQFYGTTAVGPALDPRISLTQVPIDGGTSPIDEWRSLAYVSLATAYANFVHIVDGSSSTENTKPLTKQRSLQDIFKDATPVNGGGHSCTKELVAKMKGSWAKLQDDLVSLNTKWIGQHAIHDKIDRTVGTRNWKKDLNYMYCRPLPQDLHSGPGY